MTLAFSSKSPFVPNPKKDPSDTRWIASLSDGSTVFEDVCPGKISAWQRLAEYIDLNNLKITNLRLEAYGRSVVLVPYKDSNDNAQINGYWYSKCIGALLADCGVIQAISCGIGYVKAKEIVITWVASDGTIKQEIRSYTPGDRACIINDAP